MAMGSQFGHKVSTQNQEQQDQAPKDCDLAEALFHFQLRDPYYPKCKCVAFKTRRICSVLPMIK